MDPEELDDTPVDDLDQSDPPPEDEDLDGPQDEIDEDLPEDEGQGSDPQEGQGSDPQEGRPAPTRGQNRFQTLANENRELKQRLETLERRPSDAQLERQRQQAQDRWDAMSPEEQREAQRDQRLAAAEFRAWNADDRIAFSDWANGRNVSAADRDEIEQVFQQRHANGQTVDRVTIAKYLAGEKAYAKAPRARAAGQRAEAAGRQREQVRAPSARSDTAPQGRGRMTEQQARAKRLENVKF